jgi:tRNA(fMet)-specific endonuclease VapC
VWLWDANIVRAYSDREADGHTRVLQQGRAVGWDNVGLPISVAAELLEGRLSYLREAHRRASDQLVIAFQHLEHTLEIVNSFSVLPFDGHVLNVFGRKQLFPGTMSRADRLVAAIVLAGGHILVTRNVADFAKVPGLTLENWIDDPG